MSNPFEALASKYLASGLFTHAYAECGHLGELEPAFRYEHLPQSQNIFDLSSLTKAFVTTPLSLSLWGEKVNKGLKVGDLLANSVDFSSDVQKLTVRSLLRHESGLKFWSNFFTQCQLPVGESFKQSLSMALNSSAKRLPNAGKSVYSDLGFLLIGEILERYQKQALDGQFNGLLDSIELKNYRNELGFPRSLSWSSQVYVPTAACGIRKSLKPLQGDVHDENCWALGGVTGHSGLFGSGRAVGAFLRKFSSNSTGQKIIALNAAELVPPKSGQKANEALLGWRQGADSSSECFGGGMAMGHLGFVGTAFWVEPVSKKYSVLLTNRISSGRISPAIKDFRREGFRMLWDQLS